MSDPVKYGDHARASLAPACIICGVESERPVVDHCHAHGWVRGTLCPNCNTMMAFIDRLITPGPAMARRGVELAAALGHAARCQDCSPVEAASLLPTKSLNSINGPYRKYLDPPVPARPPVPVEITQQVVLRIPDDLYARLASTAKSEFRTVRQQILHLTAQALKTRDR